MWTTPPARISVETRPQKNLAFSGFWLLSFSKVNGDWFNQPLWHILCFSTSKKHEKKNNYHHVCLHSFFSFLLRHSWSFFCPSLATRNLSTLVLWRNWIGRWLMFLTITDRWYNKKKNNSLLIPDDGTHHWCIDHLHVVSHVIYSYIYIYIHSSFYASWWSDFDRGCGHEVVDLRLLPIAIPSLIFPFALL